MTQKCNFEFRPGVFLPAVAALSIVLGAGWTVGAMAHQSPPSAASAKAKPAPPASTASGSSASPKTKMGNFEVRNLVHDEQTKTGTAQDFTYYDPDQGLKVSGDNVRYDDSDGKKFLDADGSLALDNEKNHITGDKAHILYGKKKLAIVDGHVIVVVKPKTDQTPAPDATPPKGTVDVAPITPPTGVASSDDKASAERGRGVTIYCDHLEYYYGKKHKFAIMKGHLIFKQNITKKDGTKVERTMTAEHSDYDIKNDKMLLYAPVDASDSDGQKVQFAENVDVGTKEGAETLASKGPVKGLVLHADDEEDTDDTLPPTIPAKTAAGTASKTPPPDTKNPPPTPKR